MRRRQSRILVFATLLACALAAVVAAPPATAQRTSSSTLRVGPNYPLLPRSSPIYGRDAISLAVDPRNSRHIVAMYSDYKTLWCEVAVSTDGGRDWRRSRLKAPAGFIQPPCTVGNHLANFIDRHGIAFGKGNRVYATFASGLADAQGDSTGKSVLVARSDNGGRSFGVATVALPGGPDPDVGPDYTLPKLVVNPGRGATEDEIIVAANASETEPRANPQLADPPQSFNRVIIARSDNGGRSWGARVAASPAGVSAIETTEPVLGKNNTLFLAWRTQRVGATPNSFLPEGTVMVGRSTDHGQTWKYVNAAGVRGFVYTGPVTPPYSRSPTAFDASTFPNLAADPRSGNVYLVYGNGERPLSQGQVQAADHFIHNDMDVWFQRSTDNADTWSAPVRLNRQARFQLEITQTRHPSMSVAPNGRLDVVWQDRRHWYLGPPKRNGTGVCTHTHVECDEARLGDTYYRSSRNGGVTFGPERRITDRHLNNDVGYDYRFGTYWDYGPQSVALGNNRILFAWMDSRDGNVETDDQNIYFAQANLRGSRNVPIRPVTRRNSSELALKLSRRQYPGGAEATLAATFATRPWSRVVIVNERDFAGALAGGVLARAFLGPVLLTPAGGLSDAVKREVTRLTPIGAYVIGGESSLSSQVISDLAATGIPQDQIVRIEGSGAAGTAAKIATAMDRRSDAQRAANAPAFDGAVVVNRASPDAAAAEALAAHKRLPVFFTGANALPAATSEAIRALGIPRTIVVGSTRWVSTGVQGALPRAQRVGGSDAVATSRVFTSVSRRWGLPTNVVFSTNARNKMDAALLGAAAGRIGGLLLLSPGGSSQARRVLDQLKMRTMVDHLVMAELPRAATGR
jgi:hypothetical protein